MKYVTSSYERFHSPSVVVPELHMLRKIGKETVCCWLQISEENKTDIQWIRSENDFASLNDAKKKPTNKIRSTTESTVQRMQPLKTFINGNKYRDGSRNPYLKTVLLGKKYKLSFIGLVQILTFFPETLICISIHKAMINMNKTRGEGKKVLSASLLIHVYT